MVFNLSRIVRGSVNKAAANPNKAMAALDRPTFKGFATILKGTEPQIVDRASKAFKTNSAFTSRLLGTKLW